MMMRKGQTASTITSHSSIQQPSFFKKPVNMPATLFSKSPLRQRQNRSFVGNTTLTVTRTQQAIPSTASSSMLIQNSERRKSISPLRHKRQASHLNTQPPLTSNNSTSCLPEQPPARNSFVATTNSHSMLSAYRSTPSTASKASIARIPAGVPCCTNHPNKSAKFVVVLDDEETLPYCEKCAILLASQGFQVIKTGEDISEQSQQQPIPSNASMARQSCAPPQVPSKQCLQRRRQVQDFVRELDQVLQSLASKQQSLETVVSESDASFDKQFEVIGKYYDTVIQHLNEHRKAVEETLKDQKTKAQAIAIKSLQDVKCAIYDSQFMKTDIEESLSLIEEAEQQEFRPILDSFRKNLAGFRTTCHTTLSKPICSTNVFMGDPQDMRRKIYQSINVHMQLEADTTTAAPSVTASGLPTVTKSVSGICSQKLSGSSSINFSFEGRAGEDEQEQENNNQKTAEDYEQYEYTRSHNGYVQSSAEDGWLDFARQKQQQQKSVQREQFESNEDDEEKEEYYEERDQQQIPQEIEASEIEYDMNAEQQDLEMGEGFLKSSLKDSEQMFAHDFA